MGEMLGSCVLPADKCRFSAQEELLNDRSITFKEIELCKIGEFTPGDLLEYQIFHCTGEFGNMIEPQRNRRPGRVRMIVLANKRSRARFNRQLFAQLAPQGIDIALPYFHLTAGKFPLERKGTIVATLADQQPAVSIDQPGNDRYCCA
jgi:hypothetical protein